MGDRVELRVGVVGGVAPPLLRDHITVTHDANGAAVTRRTLKAGVKTYHPKPQDYTEVAGRIDAAQWTALLSATADIWNLPTESPPGAEDIYFQDTSIRIVSGGREWANYAPEGCVHAVSTSESTPEQRERFKKIVQNIKAAVAHIQ